MRFRLAVQTVHRAAIGAFNLAVGLNRQKHAWVSVPRFVVCASAMQGQIVWCDVDDLGGWGALGHDFFQSKIKYFMGEFFSGCL